MGIINTISKNKYIPLIIALCIAMLTKEVHGFQLGITGVDYVLDLLWGAEWNVYFAVFPWFSFILIGMFFGMWYKERNRSATYLFSRMLRAGIVLITTGGGLCYYNFEYHFGDYFHLGPGGILYLAGFNLILMWLAHIMATKIKENVVFKFFYYCSKRVTTIYVIQWVLICWGMGVLGYQQLGVTGVLVLIVFYTLLTIAVQKFVLDRFFSKRKTKKQVMPNEFVNHRF